MEIDLEPSINIQKKMARLCIEENRLDDAMGIYLEILHTNPDDPDVLKELGDLYYEVGDIKSAERILGSASQKYPWDDAKEKQPETTDQTENQEWQHGPIPTSPEALQKLVQQLAHREQPISEKELMRAAKLLNDIVNSSRPAVEVANRLNEIDDLLPVLIDLNIHQAKVDGRPDLAAGLKNLKANISIQKTIIGKGDQSAGLVTIDEPGSKAKFSGKVAIYQPTDVNAENSDRMRLLTDGLYKADCLAEPGEGSNGYPDLALFSNPFLDAHLMEKMVKFSAAGVPIILDLDQYFEQSIFPGENNPKGGNLPGSIDRSFVSALILADLITVPSESYAASLQESGYPAIEITNGWTMANPYWAEKAATAGATLQMGWFGNNGDLDDLAVIRRPLIRLLNEFNDKLRLIIIGNQDAYRMFDHVPDELKTFIPRLTKEELPFILNQMDIVLMPLRKTAANEMRSDDVLMHAGVKKIPWAASSFPAVKNWGKGGLICYTPEEWHTSLRCLILDKELRQTLGMEGFHNASKREMLIHVQQWYKAFSLVQSMKKNKLASN